MIRPTRLHPAARLRPSPFSLRSLERAAGVALVARIALVASVTFVAALALVANIASAAGPAHNGGPQGSSAGGSPRMVSGPIPAGAATIQSALGTGFTYQGQLRNGQGAVSGPCDFQFSLFDALTAGTQIGSTQTKSAVTVENGVFTVQLDFGNTAFTGDARWLQIALRSPAGGGAYTALAPRQPVTSAPEALTLRPGATIQTVTEPVGATVSASNIAWANPVALRAIGGTATNQLPAMPTGVYGESATGVGVFGNSTQSYGVLGNSDAQTAVQGNSINSNGVAGMSSNPIASGVYGENLAGGFGVAGRASQFGTAVLGDNTGGGRAGQFNGTVDVSGDQSIGGNLSFGAARRQMLNLWGTQYGIGVQDLTQYYRTDGGAGFAWHQGGSHSNTQNDPGSGGRTVMTLDANGQLNVPLGGLNATDASDYGVRGAGGVGGVFGSTANLSGAGVFGINTSGGGSSSAGVFGQGNNAPGVVGQSFTSRPFVGYGSNLNDPVFYVDNAGSVHADGTYTSPAADFAELLPADDGLEPGDVLAIGDDGRLLQSVQPYQTSVVGVYSAKPAFLGGKRDVAQGVGGPQADQVPLAVIGIVPVKVTSANGPIKPGDLLVASSTPGRAMRADVNPPNGTVIGKALGRLDDGAGTIQVVIMLQ
jgi:hypothetical protein